MGPAYGTCDGSEEDGERFERGKETKGYQTECRIRLPGKETRCLFRLLP